MVIERSDISLSLINNGALVWNPREMNACTWMVSNALCHKTVRFSQTLRIFLNATYSSLNLLYLFICVSVYVCVCVGLVCAWVLCVACLHVCVRISPSVLSHVGAYGDWKLILGYLPLLIFKLITEFATHHVGYTGCPEVPWDHSGSGPSLAIAGMHDYSCLL